LQPHYLTAHSNAATFVPSIQKNMPIVFERDFGKVWFDGTTPYIFSSVVRIPHEAELNELASKQIELIRELKSTFGNVYSLLDLRQCPPLPAQFASHYINNILPNQFREGVLHKAVVEPEEKKSREVFLKAFLSVTHQPISLHQSFEKALTEINRLHDERKNHLRKGGPLAFIQNIYERLF
jgi:hypothetical protein